MTREIKFRIWSVEDGRFLNRFIELNRRFLPNGLGYEPYLDKGREVWQQFTGLKDGNGKEIYEGDIVKYNPDRPIERFGTIEYSDYYNGWSIRDSECYPVSDFGVYSLASPFLSFNNVEVIGNIFENKVPINKES